MTQGRFAERVAPAMVVLLLTPIVLVFAVLAALGSGIDIFKLGETPLALVLCAPTLCVLIRYLSARPQRELRPHQPQPDLPVGPVHIPELP
jgi:hypothetical protein